MYIPGCFHNAWLKMHSLSSLSRVTMIKTKSSHSLMTKESPSPHLTDVISETQRGPQSEQDQLELGSAFRSQEDKNPWAQLPSCSVTDAPYNQQKVSERVLGKQGQQGHLKTVPGSHP